MKYYVTADIHGFLTLFKNALRDAGYYDDPGEKKIIICGDIMDRGEEAVEMQEYILQLMEQDAVILVRGNHEDLFQSLVTEDAGLPYRHHVHNGTYDTALQLTGFTPESAREHNYGFADKAKETPYYRIIIPSMLDYYETKNYVFVHGWIPCVIKRGKYCYVRDWRNSSPREWAQARWDNGMDVSPTCEEEKTIVCGHWNTSYGHSKYEGKGSEFGEDADFSPYYGPGIIALDACTAHSGWVNVIILEDDLVE